MSEFSDEKIYQEVGKIVSQFKIFQCYECAEAVMKWLEENGIEGRVIKIRTKNPRKEPYIISEIR